LNNTLHFDFQNDVELAHVVAPDWGHMYNNHIRGLLRSHTLLWVS